MESFACIFSRSRTIKLRLVTARIDGETRFNRNNRFFGHIGSFSMLVDYLFGSWIVVLNEMKSKY